MSALTRGLPRAGRPRPVELWVTLGLSAVAGAVAASSGDWAMAFAVIVLFTLLTVGMVRPVIFLAVFLLVRPMLENVGVENAPAAIAVVLLAMFASVLVTHHEMIAPSATAAFLGVVAVTGITAFEGLLDYRSTLQTDIIGEVARVLALFAMYVLSANLLADRVRRLVLLVGISGVVPAVYGIVRLITDPTVNENAGVARANGPFNGPNPFGVYLAFSLLVLLATPREWISNWVRLAAAIPIGTALVLTYSRGGWSFFLIGALLLFTRRRPWAVASIAVVTVAVTLSVPTVHDRLLPTNDPTKSQEQSYESFEWRLENWRVLLDKWQERPWLGYGLQTTTTVNPRVPTSGAGRSDGGYDAHNMAVRILVEGGVVLLVAWAALFAVMFVTTWRLAHRDWEFKSIGRLVQVLWWLLLINGLTVADTLGTTAMMFPLLALTGAVEGAYRARRAEPAQPPAPEPAHFPSNGEAGAAGRIPAPA